MSDESIAEDSGTGRRLKVAVAHDYLGVAEQLADWTPVRALADVDFLGDAYADEAQAAEALAGYDIVCSLRERQPLTADLIRRLPRMRLFVAASEVNRKIDFDAADANSLQVAGTPSGAYARAATAELTWGLIIAAARGIVTEDRAIRDGRWQTGVFPALHGKTIGVVGLGGTGRYIARFAREFGMDVLAWSPHLTEMTALESAAEAVDLDDLLRRSDVVSLHIVLSESTHHLMDARRIGLLKTGGDRRQHVTRSSDRRGGARRSPPRTPDRRRCARRVRDGAACRRPPVDPNWTTSSSVPTRAASSRRPTAVGTKGPLTRCWPSSRAARSPFATPASHEPALERLEFTVERMKGKVVIVTGGARGLGGAAASALAREGASVVVADILEDEGNAKVEEITWPAARRASRSSTCGMRRPGRGSSRTASRRTGAWMFS